MESERQAKRVPELPSKKDTSNNLPSEPGETIKVFEKNLERLENLSGGVIVSSEEFAEP
ncbi:hypothetical protein RhiirC2_802559 [Rhizophagus irregularis]|uniref:Uncharacterized protein n=1 Tax=Rhizophagus irregularis TaxID=588596 RepID=A0A2N1M162_9GLOM|nr:hypothetical protein RhiirC2_802559 [Rhizophagus irregularis]